MGNTVDYSLMERLEAIKRQADENQMILLRMFGLPMQAVESGQPDPNNPNNRSGQK